MKEYKVYMHTFPNNKRYIGITKQDINKRWSNGCHYKNQFVFRAIEKYGWENIKHEILFDNLSKEEACKLEQKLIRKYKSNQKEYGYNHSIGGEIGKKSTYMCEKAVEFMNTNNCYREAKKIYKWWKKICEDELEAKVFNNAYFFVDSAINNIKNKDEIPLRIEWFHKIGAINYYLEAWINNWEPKCAEYNSLYYLINHSEVTYYDCFDKENDKWKLKIPIKNNKQLNIFDILGDDINDIT